jgi:parvulin-like peptidyl-prolyl isomerase
MISDLRLTLRAPALTLAVLANATCGGEPPPALTVGAVSYTESQLLGLSDSRRATLADLAAFGQAMADSSFMELGRPLIDEQIEDRLLEILAAELTLEKNDVGDDVLEARYLTDPQWELVVRHILFFSERWRSPQHRAEAEAKAARAMELLRGGADFAETAAELSEEPGAEGRQGLLTPGREGSWVPEFWAAAVALDPGEISPVTETQYGYHILRLEDRSVVPFREARSVVARQVAERIEDPRAVLAVWMSRASDDPVEARSAALAEADRRGLAVPETERVEIERAWDDITYRFGLTFGFRYGATPTQVGEAALAALANPAQNAALSRRELEAYRGLLERRYPRTLGAEG